MASVNKVILVGNLGKDPEVRYSADGGAICNLSMATTSSWKDKASGDRREEVEWHRVIFYGKLAEIVGEYLRKGSPIYVEGRLKTRKWQNKEGVDQYTTEIVADQMQMLGSKGQASEGSSQSAASNKPLPQSQAQRPAPAARTGGASAGSHQPSAQLADIDDIPFLAEADVFDMEGKLARRARRSGAALRGHGEFHKFDWQ